MIFGVDNSSSSHSDNRNNNFLTLREGPIYGINASLGSPEKEFNINLVKKTLHLILVYIIMLIIVICLLMESKSLNLKLTKTYKLSISILSRKYIY